MARLGGSVPINDVPFSAIGQPPADLSFASDSASNATPFGRTTINVPELDNRQIDSDQYVVIGGSILLRFNGSRPQDGRSLPCLTLQEFLMRFYHEGYLTPAVVQGAPANMPITGFGRDYYNQAVEPYQAMDSRNTSRTDLSTMMRREGVVFATTAIAPSQNTLVNVAIGRVARVKRIFGQVHTGDRIYLGKLPYVGFFFVVRSFDSMDLLAHVREVANRLIDDIDAANQANARAHLNGFHLDHLVYIGMAMEDSFDHSTDTRTGNNRVRLITSDRHGFTNQQLYMTKTLAEINTLIERKPSVLIYLD